MDQFKAFFRRIVLFVMDQFKAFFRRIVLVGFSALFVLSVEQYFGFTASIFALFFHICFNSRIVVGTISPDMMAWRQQKWNPHIHADNMRDFGFGRFSGIIALVLSRLSLGLLPLVTSDPKFLKLNKFFKKFFGVYDSRAKRSVVIKWLQGLSLAEIAAITPQYFWDQIESENKGEKLDLFQMLELARELWLKEVRGYANDRFKSEK